MKKDPKDNKSKLSSILYIIEGFKYSVVPFVLVYIPLWLGWNIYAYFILLVLTLLSILALLLIKYSSYKKLFYYDGEFLGIFIGHKLRLLFNERLYRYLWPIIISRNGVTWLALVEYPFVPSPTANVVMTIAQAEYDRGEFLHTCFMGEFVAPDYTTWYRLIRDFNLTVGIGYDIFILIRPFDYTYMNPGGMYIPGTSTLVWNQFLITRLVF